MSHQQRSTASRVGITHARARCWTCGRVLRAGIDRRTGESVLTTHGPVPARCSGSGLPGDPDVPRRAER